MTIEKITIKIAEIVKDYKDNGIEGVFSCNNKLNIRPAFQREFYYKDKQREAVIKTILNNYPLGVMYWSKEDDGTFEVIDGQQRIISIAQYVANEFSIRMNVQNTLFKDLSELEKEKIMNYRPIVYICSGTEGEKLEWFKTINIAGETLTPQELLNATYTGAWLTDAKNYFSKPDCPAEQISDNYVEGCSIRQDYLEKALEWIADRDSLESGQVYMAIHQHDASAADLWRYFQDVITWAKTMFPTNQKGITDNQEWGILYNKYHERFNESIFEKEIML